MATDIKIVEQRPIWTPIRVISLVFPSDQLIPEVIMSIGPDAEKQQHMGGFNLNLHYSFPSCFETPLPLTLYTKKALNCLLYLQPKRNRRHLQ